MERPDTTETVAPVVGQRLEAGENGKGLEAVELDLGGHPGLRFEKRPGAGERRAQLVAHVGDEAPLSFHGLPHRVQGATDRPPDQGTEHDREQWDAQHERAGEVGDRVAKALEGLGQQHPSAVVDIVPLLHPDALRHMDAPGEPYEYPR